MKLEIYRKYSTPVGYVLNDEPETVFEGINWFTVENGYIVGCIGDLFGEELTVKIDRMNYEYRFSK